ncbi:autophagy-related protein 18g isoform X3 [Ricinus communis]|nr:autophagy-related protein 18g isoform X3 [Ricinus communis]
MESQPRNCISSPTSVRFYSLRSHCYVHVLRFRSAVRMVRCSPRIIAVGLATQIYCIDALTLESKFSVLTYPVPQLAGQGGINVGYGPMAVGPRWLAYASNNPLVSNTTRLSAQSLTPSPGVSPSTSPGGTSLVARYAMESSKQLAAGIINLGDMGYKTFSKYCQELLPDGSNSPVSPSSGWKVGRLAGSDMDTAGMVVVKDFVSRVVISQFKAHTSPISALCFDPSGTLLVTASIYGNNINIFRIMPSCSRGGLGVQSYDWSSSHVHLYKLHRGMTSAMIQDICFSHYSQWIAIVSSKGTCHVFVLSPFGGDSGFQSLNSMGVEPSLYPILSLPWWSTSSWMINQQPYPPPPPVSLSVVSRIKYSSFGWLNTVGNATGSAAGKVFVPSGAVAAVFHNSICQSAQHVNSRANPLEHLLVYTPSGHVVQHELLPSIGLELGESGSKIQPASFVHIQEDDMKVKVEPVQWWDVCRRSDWSEREESVIGSTNGQDAVEIITRKPSGENNFEMVFLDTNGDVNEKKSSISYSMKPHEKSHWYLSNAEVQISSVRLPIWQKSKICFYVMDSPRVNYNDGEFEIEKVPIQEVELKRKELLPVFDHFHSFKSGWNDRGIAVARYIHSPSSEAHQAEGKSTQETIICHSKPASLSSTGSSECGSSRRIENLLDLDQINCEKSYIPICQTLNDYYQETRGGPGLQSGTINQNSLTIASLPSEHPKNGDASVDNCIENGLPSSPNYLPPAGRIFAGEAPTLNIKRTGDVSASPADNYDSQINILMGVPALPVAENPVGFELSFQEGHYKALDLDRCCTSTEVVTDDVDSSSSHCEKEKPEEDGENDEFLGGMFAFSEEG